MWGHHWRGGVKMFRLAQLNVFTPQCKKAGTPYCRLMCHC